MSAAEALHRAGPGGALGEDTLADGGVLAVDHEDRLLKRRRGDAGALVGGAGDVAGKRDADDLVAGIDGLLEEVLEHHGGIWLVWGSSSVSTRRSKNSSREVDALGVLSGAECDGHGDDGNVVGAGVALFHVRRRVHDDAEWPQCLRVNCVFLHILSSVHGALLKRGKGK